MVLFNNSGSSRSYPMLITYRCIQFCNRFYLDQIWYHKNYTLVMGEVGCLVAAHILSPLRLVLWWLQFSLRVGVKSYLLLLSTVTIHPLPEHKLGPTNTYCKACTMGPINTGRGGWVPCYSLRGYISVLQRMNVSTTVGMIAPLSNKLIYCLFNSSTHVRTPMVNLH